MRHPAVEASASEQGQAAASWTAVSISVRSTEVWTLLVESGDMACAPSRGRTLSRKFWLLAPFHHCVLLQAGRKICIMQDRLAMRSHILQGNSIL